MTFLLFLLSLFFGIAYLIASFPNGVDKCEVCGGDLWMRKTSAICVECGKKQ